jgi:hypothetical protein
MGIIEERLERVAGRQVVRQRPGRQPRSAERRRTAQCIRRALDDIEAFVGGQRVDLAMEVGGRKARHYTRVPIGCRAMMHRRELERPQARTSGTVPAPTRSPT